MIILRECSCSREEQAVFWDVFKDDVFKDNSQMIQHQQSQLRR